MARARIVDFISGRAIALSDRSAGTGLDLRHEAAAQGFLEPDAAARRLMESHLGMLMEIGRTHGGKPAQATARKA
jgi:hypothetical protein